MPAHNGQAMTPAIGSPPCTPVRYLDLLARAKAHIDAHLWWHLPAGRYAVFTHLGPYAGLHAVWSAIYREWLPATGYALRDVPPFKRPQSRREAQP
jgi:predicted transcriptional regulator YdeE